MWSKSRIYLTYLNLQEAPETTHPPVFKKSKIRREGGVKCSTSKTLDNANMSEVKLDKKIVSKTIL